MWENNHTAGQVTNENMRFACRITTERTQIHSRYITLITVNSSTKHFVARQHSTGTPLFHFHCNTEHFYIVDSYIYAKNNKKGGYCYVSTAKNVTRTRHNVTLYVHYLSCLTLHVKYHHTPTSTGSKLSDQEIQTNSDPSNFSSTTIFSSPILSHSNKSSKVKRRNRLHPDRLQLSVPRVFLLYRYVNRLRLTAA